MYKFEDIIVDNFEEIRNNFKIGLNKKGYLYNEDIMNDAFISCMKTLQNKLLTKKDAIKYYWTAYINKYKTYSKQSKKFIEMIDDIIDINQYNIYADILYDEIIKAIRDKFGVRKAFIWEMYVCQGKTSKEIRSMGFNDIDNFIYFNRQVKRYLTNHILNKKHFLELANNRFEDGA